MSTQLPEGTVTILFTDVEGSTALRTSRGDAAADEVFQSKDRLVREQITAHGGIEIKNLGDGFMVAFASARKAVACAVAIQKAVDGYLAANPSVPTRVRIGLNSGEVTQQNGDLMGAAVNAAARIAAKADGGQILVAGVVKDLAGVVPDCSYINRGRFRLKGFPDRWQLFEVGWQREAAAVPVQPLEQRTSFVGRESEKAEIVRRLESALGGHTEIVMIGGEPGIGKTRLTEEVAAEAEKRGFRVNVGHCYEVEGGTPYAPFVEILDNAIKVVPADLLREVLGDSAAEVARLLPHLRRLYPDIPPPLELPPEQERRYIFNSVRDFIARAAEIRPQFYIWEDLHWADESTLLLMEHLAEGLTASRVMALGTYRDVELAVARPLARSLESLLRKRIALDITLRRLPEQQVGEMLRTLGPGSDAPGALVAAIYRETEGNPFFVEEVFKHLAEEGKLFEADGGWRTDLGVGEVEVPRGVRLVIGRRLERLSENSRKALVAAAAVGRAFSYRMLERLAEIPEDDLLDAVDEAERAALITSTASGAEASFMFAHELIRQTLLGDVSLPRRQRLHLRIADAMQSLYGADAAELASEIAHHLYQAGEAADANRTASYLILAGQRALDSAAFEDALRALERAGEVHPPEDRRGRADLLYKLGLAHRSLGRIEEAMASWRGALDIYDELGEKDIAARLCSDMSSSLAWASRFQESLEIASRGMSLAGDAPSPTRVRLMARMAIPYSFGGAHDSAEQLVQDAVQLSDQLGDTKERGFARYVLMIHRFAYMRFSEAREIGEQAVSLLREADASWDLANALSFFGMSNSFTGRNHEREEVREELEPLAQRVGNYGALNLSNRLAWNDAFLDQDDPIAAFQDVVERDLAFNLTHNVGYEADSYVGLGIYSLARGQLDEMLAQFEEAVRRAPASVLGQADHAPKLLGLAHLGRRDELLDYWRTLEDGVAKLGRPNGIGAWVTSMTALEAFAIVGDLDRSAQFYEHAIQLMGLGPAYRWFDYRLLETLAGISAGAGAQWEEAEGHFEAALRFATENPTPFELPDARRYYAQMLIRRGAVRDLERARALLGDARRDYLRLGMPYHVRLAEELIRQA